MQPIRTLIADDDAGMRLVMRKLIEKNERFHLVGEAEDGKKLIAMNESLKPEVIFLDVEMPEMSGIECAKIIQDRDPKTVLIFATAHEKYMGDAFEVYAFDYLLKPFKLERVEKTLALIIQRLRGADAAEKLRAADIRETAGRLMLKHKEGVSFLNMDEIILIQREERATVLYLVNNVRYVTSDALGDMEERLPAGPFMRTHKSYIVNIRYIDTITPYGRWTYVIRLRGTEHDALITHEKFEELQALFA